jgi:hypothetical protein
MSLMKIFSLSHMIELATQLPDPAMAANAETGYNTVVRLPILDWDAVRDAEHPERKFDAHEDAFVEFELLQWKDTIGRTIPRWVLRGLVAI